MAVTASFASGTGLLDIDGGSLANTVVVNSIDVGGSLYLMVSDHGVTVFDGRPTDQDVLASAVQRIDASGADGGDVFDLRSVDLSNGFTGVRSVTLDGGLANDTILGSAFADLIKGEAGDDYLEGGGGNDTLEGGSGEDYLLGGSDDDSLIGGDDADVHTFDGSLLGSDTITEGADGVGDTLNFEDFDAAVSVDISLDTLQTINLGNLQLTLNSATAIVDVWDSGFADDITGNDLDNFISLSGGDDVVDGGLGDDIYWFAESNNGSDTVTESSSSGQDWLSFFTSTSPLTLDLSSTAVQTWGSGDLSLVGPENFEHVVGTSFGDVIVGNSAANYLLGLGGNDSLGGRIGADVLLGDLGDDYLIGGDGDDMLFGGAGVDQLSGDLGEDLLVAATYTPIDSLLTPFPMLREVVGVADELSFGWTAGSTLADRLANVTGASGATNPIATGLQLSPGTTILDDSGTIDLLMPLSGTDAVFLDSRSDLSFMPISPNEATFVEVDPTWSTFEVTFASGILTVTQVGGGDIVYSVDAGHLLVNGQHVLGTPLNVEDVEAVVSQLGIFAGDLDDAALTVANLPNVQSIAYTRSYGMEMPPQSAADIDAQLESLVGPDWELLTNDTAEDIATAFNAGNYDPFWQVLFASAFGSGGQQAAASSSGGFGSSGLGGSLSGTAFAGRSSINNLWSQGRLSPRTHAWHEIADSLVSGRTEILAEPLAASSGSSTSSWSIGGEGTRQVSVEDAEDTIEGGLAYFPLTYSGGAHSGFTVDWTTEEGTALSESADCFEDYQAREGTALTWTEGSEGDALVAVKTNDDYLVEPDEDFKLRLVAIHNNPGGGSPASLDDTLGVANIIDDSTLPKATIVGNHSVTEGDPGDPIEPSDRIRILVQLDHPYQEEVRVPWSTTDITTEGSADYTPLSGEVVFAPITCSQPGDVWQLIEIEPVRDDVSEEAEEKFKITIEAGTNSTVSSTFNTVIGTIYDDDVGITVEDADPVIEGGTALFRVTLSTSHHLGVSFEYSTQDGSAVDGIGTGEQDPADYSAAGVPNPAVLYIPPFFDSSFISISTYNDDFEESVENFSIILSNPSDDATLLNSSALGTILDNDTTPTVSISDAFAIERDPGDSDVYAVFTVSLDRPFDEVVTVDAATRNGNLLDPPAIGYQPGNDFDHKSETITFNANQTSKEFKVKIRFDDIVEPDEYFYVDLSNPVNADPGDMIGRGKIADDDAISEFDPALQIDEDCECGDPNIDENEHSGNVHASQDGSNYATDTNPHPIFGFKLTLPDHAAGNVLLSTKAELVLGDLSVVEVHYADTAGSSAPELRIPIQVDATTLPTGVYDWTIILTTVFGESGTGANQEVFTNTLTGRRVIVNRINSEFGMRWWADDLDQLFPVADGVGLALGTGQTAFFKGDGIGPYTTPDGWFDTLVKNGDGTYTLTAPNGSRREFASDGLLQERVDRNGNETVYSYTDADGDTKIDELSTVVDPFGRTRTYSYTTDSGLPQFGKVETTTDYAGRVTEWDIDSLGRVSAIRTPDPDDEGSLVPLETLFEYYPTTNLLKTLTRSNGIATTWEYDFARRVTKRINNDGTFILIEPIQTRGLIDLTQVGSTALNPAALTIAATPASGSITNERNYTSTFTTDRFGYLTQWTDPFGHTTQYERDKDGLLTTLTLPDPDGASPGREATIVSYTYDGKGNQLTEQYGGSPARVWTYDSANGQVTSYTDELGRKTVYHLDSSGNVLIEQRIVGTQDSLAVPVDDVLTSFAYTNSTDGVPVGMVRFITDPLNRVTEYRYYGQSVFDDASLNGLVKSITYAKGTPEEATVSFEYNTGTRNLYRYHDELGRVTEYVYDNLDRLTKVIEPDPDLNPTTLVDGPLTSPEWIYAYCPCGQLRTITDPEGNLTEYEYDDRNRIDTIRLPKPLTTDPSNPEWTYEYDGVGNLTKVTDPLGYFTEYVYDAANRLIQVKEPDPDGVAPTTDQPIWVYGYDDADLLTSVTDPEGRVTTYNYDTRLRQTEVTLPEPVIGQGHPSYTYVYDDADQVKEIHAPLGRVTKYDYHPDLGWLTQVTEPDPDGAAPTTDQPVWSYAHDPLGNVTKVTDPRGHETDFLYDARYRLTKVTEPAAALGGTRPVRQYGYDLASQLTSVTDPEDRVQTFEYDYLGRVLKQSEPDPDGGLSLLEASTAFTYDAVGNVLTETNALSETTNYEYDNLFRLRKEIDPLGKETLFDVDFVGNLLSLTDPEQNTTTWQYDDLNRVELETNELAFQRSYVYDRVGNLQEYNDRRGLVTEYDYDRLDRLTQERWVEQGATIHTINYGYDLANRMTSGSDTVASYSYYYDKLDRVSWEIGSHAGLLSPVYLLNQWDTAGNRTQVAAVIGTTNALVNDFVYDDLNRLKQVNQYGVPGGSPVAEKRVDFLYNLAGQFDEIHRYADLAGTKSVIDSVFAYDEAGRLESLTHGQGALSFGHQFEYDRANRVIRHEYYSGGALADAWDYVYDDRDQLTQVLDGITVLEDYDYDDNGNRDAVDGVAWQTTANNQLYRDGTYQYEYDAEGNRTKRILLVSGQPTGATEEYTWDHRNRLTAVTFKSSPGGSTLATVIYAYDVFDRKVRRDVDTDGNGIVDTREYYLHDGDDVLLDMYDQDANGPLGQMINARYLHGPGVDQILAQENIGANETYWHLGDHLQTTRDIVYYDDNTGQTVAAEHLDYDAFGNVLTSSSITRYLYTAREYDVSTGLQYNRARWYDSGTGRWISEDPIGFAAGDANLNRYVGNSPTNATDSSGLASRWFNGIKILVDKVSGELVLENGSRIKAKNIKYAGCSVSLDDLARDSNVSKKTLDKLREDRGDDFSIFMDKYGQFDFSDVIEASVDLPDPGASNYRDQAWRKLQIKDPTLYNRLWKDRSDYQWHHAPDGTLQLIDKDLHTAFQHTGLSAVLKNVGGTACMIIPGAAALSEGRVNDGLREAAWSFNPLGWISDTVSGYFEWLYDSAFEDVYGDDPRFDRYRTD